MEDQYSPTLAQKEEFMRRTAEVLGHGWTYEPGDQGTWGTIQHTDGRVVTFDWPHLRGGMIRIAGKYPQRFDGTFYEPRHLRQRGEKFQVSMNADPEKPPTRLAAEIRRRMLPGYSKLFHRAKEVDQQLVRKASILQQMCERLANVLKPEHCEISRGNGSRMPWIEYEHEVGGQFKPIYDPSSDSEPRTVDITLRLVPFTLAQRICALVAAPDQPEISVTTVHEVASQPSLFR